MQLNKMLQLIVHIVQDSKTVPIREAELAQHLMPGLENSRDGRH